MKLPRTRNRWTERVMIDNVFDAYLEWREESAEVWQAFQRWNGAPAREARRKFWAYRAALEREEHAARVYGQLAVVTRPNVEHLSMQAFLRALTYAAKPRPALGRAA